MQTFKYLFSATKQFLGTFYGKTQTYIIGEIGEPVPADVTVTPQGDFTEDDYPQYVSITVSNADIFNCVDIDKIITVKDNNGTTIEMEPGTKSGNTLKWEFPYDAAAGKAAMLPKGSYTITINYSQISAYTSDLHPIEFPTDNTYTFNMEGGVTRVTPECTFNPAPGKYDSWTASGITIKFNNYKLTGLTTAQLRAIQLVVLDPDMESTTYTVTRGTTQQLGYQVSAFTKDGTYKCILKIEGLSATDITTEEEVEFQNVEFEYVIGNPAVDAEYTLDPTENASMVTDEFKQVKLTITNAASLEIAADAPSLLSIINDATQEATQAENPVVSGNTITWTMPDTWSPEAGSYSVAIYLAEGVSGKTADNADIKFPDNIEYTITLTAPIVREAVNPDVTFTPAAGDYTKWTATTIACVWNTKYKLDKDGRDMYIGRTITFQKPDGSIKEIVLSRATDTGVGKINFLRTELTVSADMFDQIGTYTITFPIEGLIGAEAANADNLIIFDSNAVVQYTMIEPKIDAEYTLTPAAGTVYAPTDVVPDIVLTVSNAKSVSITEGYNPIIVTETDDNTYVEMLAPVIEGNTVTWKFPEGWDNPAGTYRVSVDTNVLSGVGASNETVVFPENIATDFVIEPAVVTPQFTAYPEPGEYHTWINENGIQVSLSDYMVESEEAAKAVKLTITGPDDESREFDPIADQTSNSFFSYAVTDEFINKIGVYKCTLNLTDLIGRNMETYKKVKLENISFAYDMYGKPIDAEMIITPAAETVYAPTDEIPAVTLTVSNAESLSINEDANPISVIETIDNIAVEMQAPVIEGNTITWQFPTDWDKNVGTYNVVVNFSDISGRGADRAEIIFPQEFGTNFIIASNETPDFTVYPEPGEYHTWDNNQGVMIALNNYVLKSDDAARAVKLTVTAPDSEVKEYLPVADRTATNFLSYDVTDEFINKIGVYTFAVALDGLDATNTQTNKPARLEDISFAYEMYGKPIDAALLISPAENAVIAPTEEMSGIVLTVSNALSINLPEGTNPISVVEAEDNVNINMSMPTIEGNTITWLFPEGWDNPAGTYNVNIQTSTITGTGADKAEVIFPSNYYSSFVIETAAVTPQYTVIPEPGEYHTWNNQLGIMVSLTDYMIASKDAAETVILTVTAPDGESRRFSPKAGTTSMSFLTYDVTDEFINKLGVYACTVELDGLLARNMQTAKKVKLENISFEYTMYAKPIDAVLSLTPDKNTIFSPAQDLDEIVLTIENALTLNIAEGINPIVVCDPSENHSVDMSAPVIEGNTVTWKFPESWNNPAGHYDITIDLTAFTGSGVDDAEVIFPAVLTSTFTIDAAVVTPECEASPIPGDYTYWDNDMPVLVSIIGYELQSKEAAEAVQLTITDPAGKTCEFLPIADFTSPGILAYQVSDDVMSELGEYTFTIELNGLHGIDTATGKTVVFNNIDLYYTMTPLEVEMYNVIATPASGSAFGVWTDKEITLDWAHTGYTLTEESIEQLKGMSAVIKRDGLPIKEIALTDTESTADDTFAATEGADIKATGMTLYIDPATFENDGDYEVIIPLANLIGYYEESNVKVEFTDDIKLDYKVDIALGIDSIIAVGEGEAWYNINGYRVNRPTEKGIYIKVDADGKATRVYIK